MRYAVVDLSNLFHRCRHVTIGEVSSKIAMALQILFRSLRRLHRQHRIDHIVFAVDAGSWRQALHGGYKAARRRASQADQAQERLETAEFAAVLRDLVGFLHARTRCTVLEQAQIEGDDFVARWIQRHPRDEHVIVSGDSDFVQLLAPNVWIFDGVQENLIGIDAIINTQGQKLAFTVKPSDGKIKLGPPCPDFVPEPEWWKKALFIKLIRGDAGDGIFAAYPGVRYQGSDRRVGIAQAWADRHDQGYHWNNFFQAEWQKLLGVAADGSRLTRTVRVIDEYRANIALIDLTAQPEDIRAAMDAVIDTAIAKPLVGNVGIHFLRFCGVHHLPALASEAADHAAYLNAPYARRTDVPDTGYVSGQ